MRTIKVLSSLILCLAFNRFCFAQTTSAITDKSPGLDSVDYDIGFTPLLNTAIIAPKTCELILFNSFQTQKIKTFKMDDTLNTKASSLSHIFQINYGLVSHPNINVGMDLYYTHVRSDNNLNSSFLEVLGNSSESGKSVRAISLLGPRVRVAPIKRVPELTLQSSLLFPAMRSSLRREQLGIDRTTLQNQLLFYQHFMRKITYQVQVSHAVKFKNIMRNQTSHYFSYGTYLIYNVYSDKVYTLIGATYNESREYLYSEGFTRLSYDLLINAGGYWRFGKKFSALLMVEAPVKYNIGSLTKEIHPHSWWKINMGLNYRFNL